MAVDPRDPVSVGAALTSFIAAHLGVTEVRLAEAPKQVPYGWDTHTWFFGVEGAAVPDAWTRPLVLRLYADAEQQARAETEVAIQRFISGRGFPAARPLAFVGAEGPFGAPFMIMERLPGEPMLNWIARNPLRIWRGCARLADLHASLHGLDPSGWPVAETGPLVDRRLAFLRDAAERFAFHDLDAGIAWLDTRKSIVIPEERIVCHGDFHPLNILVDARGRFSVVDWASAFTGDRHADVANTLLELTRVPTTSLPLAQRALAAVVRRLVGRRYLSCYRRRLPVDLARLRYWEVFGTLAWALQFALFVRDGSETLGLKAESTRYIRPAHAAMFRRRFEELADAWTD